MNSIGQSERATQNRVVKLFTDELGYDYLGNWQDRANNSNVETSLVTQHLTASGYSPSQISRTLRRLTAAANNPNATLYENNKAVYSYLYHGIQIKPSASENYRDYSAN